ncbi:alpha/beta hydrolase family protein [Lunatibacter salilacus]|uniref:alpha/beta hydrolase family protein n=1 Tax=Lunatibacter salilacus TaxID=2483804 RepID=UPI00131D69DF|nr:dienelactone hydrolase family protein [Lunatibacter salilacus]
MNAKKSESPSNFLLGIDTQPSGKPMPTVPDSINRTFNTFHIKYGFLLFLFVGYLISNSASPVFGQDDPIFESTLLLGEFDFSQMMVNGIGEFLDEKTKNTIPDRSSFWDPDFSNEQAYETSVSPNRQRLLEILGAVDPILPKTQMEFLSTTEMPSLVAENKYFEVFSVRWQVLKGVYGEGLLLQPKGKIKSRVVVLPDADQTPEDLVGMSSGLHENRQYARLLAENGCQVIIPTIIDRSSHGSGSERMDRFTNQPHREWIYRQAFTFGGHIIGYEVQKIRAALGWFESLNKNDPTKIGVVGWGEGALLGFYTAAVDTRIDVAYLSGYFSKREDLWQEPIYRNLSGFLKEFGDAEVASLIVPRTLMIEYSRTPEINGPPPAVEGPSRLGASAAPGKINTPVFNSVKKEVERAKNLSGKFHHSIHFIHEKGKVVESLNRTSIALFLEQIHPNERLRSGSGKSIIDKRAEFNPAERQLRQVKELEEYTQNLIYSSRHLREAFFWNKMEPVDLDSWMDKKKYFQDYLWDEIIGRIPSEKTFPIPKSRKIYDEGRWTGHEIILDAGPGIFLWGYFLLPKDLKKGEKRPVMVVMHGGSGLPEVVMDNQNKTYKGLAEKLVEQGYVVFAPHFPWRAGDDYRNLQRKANPLGLSVFSIILHQHEKLLDWLTELSFIDPEKIGFYGLSWGGKVAVRIPALLERYSLSICSGDFNEWIWKNATTDWSNSYMFAPEYEMFDFNLGMTFNYGEMAALMAPRAFMVERGHDDGVGIDEWVAFEYAKVNRLYNRLDIPHKTTIEYFNGGHEINAKGTLQFIKQHYNRESNK